MLNEIKDLREMNEEQFKTAFEWLRVKTNNFTRFTPELLIEDSRVIFVVRCCLGLSQKEFGELLGSTKDWTRHTESGRNKIIHLKPANRKSSKIENLLKSKRIDIESTLDFWKQFKFARAQKFPEITTKSSSILKMSEKELIKRFEVLKDQTKNFTEFNPNILFEMPQNILIFRLILGISHKKFGEIVGNASRGVRRWESGISKIKFETAEKIVEKLGQLMKEKTIELDDIILNHRLLTNKHGHRNLEASIRHGLMMAKNQPLADVEKLISNYI